MDNSESEWFTVSIELPVWITAAVSPATPRFPSLVCFSADLTGFSGGLDLPGKNVLARQVRATSTRL